jgi:hypothetical protein
MVRFDMAAPVELRYQKLGPRVAEALKNRHFDAWYFDNPAEAMEKIVALIPKDHTGFMGRFADRR